MFYPFQSYLFNICYYVQSLCSSRNSDYFLSTTFLALPLVYTSSIKFSSLMYTYLLTYLFTYLLTYSMVQSPSSEANWFASSQEIPRISRNPKVRYRTHKRPPPVFILGQPNPVHIPTSHLLEIHPNIIHTPTPRSPQRFPHQDPIHPLSSPIRTTCPAHLILLDFITRTILGEEYKSFSSSLCNLLHTPVTSSLLGPNILLNTLFSNTLSFLSSRSVNDPLSCIQSLYIHNYHRSSISSMF